MRQFGHVAFVEPQGVAEIACLGRTAGCVVRAVEQVAGETAADGGVGLPGCLGTL